jgi:adenylate cyclase
MAAPLEDLRRTPLRRRLLLGALAGGLAGGVALALAALLPDFEELSLDWRTRLLARKTQAVDQVAIALIDNESLANLNDPDLRWPWPRELQAAMVSFLKSAGALAVVFDVLFVDDSRVGAADDRALAQAIREAGNVRLGAKLEGSPVGAAGGSAPGIGDPAALAPSAVQVSGWNFPPRKDRDRIVAPIPELLKAGAPLGIVSVEQGSGNTLRAAELVFPFQGRLLPSLGLAGALAALPPGGPAALEGRHLNLRGRRIPLEPDGRLLVRYYGPEITFPTYHAADLIQSWGNMADGKKPVIDPARFKDRVVFVGVNIAAMEDIVTAPTSHKFPGVEYHATVCANLLGGEFLERPIPAARAALLLLAALCAGLLSFGLWKPLPAAVGALGLGVLWTAVAGLAFPKGLVLDLFYPLAAIAGAYTTSAATGYLTEGRRKREVAQAFGQYLSPVVIHDLLRQPGGLKLGGERREITVFFSDLRGFSTFSEGMGPEELVSFLNVYLGAMTDLILERRGVVDKYEGDAIMAFWGAPERITDDALQACLCAIEQRQALESLNQRFRAEGRPELFLRAGLHRGPAVVGNMGSPRRFAYTAMGDTVNLASRLEGANKFFGTSLLLSEEARRAAGEGVVARRLGRIRVVGRSIPTAVHELVGKTGEVDAEILARIRLFEEALGLLEGGDLGEAARFFERYLSGGADRAAERCLEIAREHSAASARAWEGVWELTAK